MVSPEKALPGRNQPVDVPLRHRVLQTPLVAPFPPGAEHLALGMGCFWGTEKVFWNLPGVYTTAAGYCGGFTPNPNYDEILSGMTGHAEVALVVFNSMEIGVEAILTHFFEGHDPTQNMRQGRDVGTQYRSCMFYTSDVQRKVAEEMRSNYQRALLTSGFGPIRTSIEELSSFYYAEDFHQQFLSRHPERSGGQAPTGVRYSGYLAC